jgi:hypothetical protein
MSNKTNTNVDHISRRNFLMVSAAVPTVVVAGSLGRDAFAVEAVASAPAKKYPIGLEL